jgi:signal transduction histidine kinase
MDPVTILNVDDYEPGRFARTQLLRSFGFTVREAATGREALSVAAEEAPKLVILDVNLPDMSGLEVCRRLKSSATTAAVAVLHMSATYVDPVHKALGLESGADAYLTEPVDPPVLLATVKALLRMKRAEEAQRASAAEWQVTFDAISDGVALLDSEGVIVRRNAAFRDLLGEHGDVGRALATLLGAGAFARMRERGGRETTELELGARWLCVTMDPIPPGRDVLGAVCTVADVTDRKRIEEERGRLLAREQAARAAAEAANRSQEDFIAMLAHELRNPLAPIRMAMATLRGPGRHDPTIQRATDIVERQSRHLARLLDDLVDAARLTREKIELRPSPTTLEAVVAEALEASRELIDTRGHAVEIALPAEPLVLHADPTRLAQVVGNLIGNAAKYTPPGGRIVLRGAREGGEVVLSVRDTGRGIPAEILPRIFELFTQGPGAEGGLGVGLALARMLVELHGGTLTAASEGVGRGSEFVVRLPIGAASTVADRNGGPAHARLPARRILLIEDDDDTRDVLRLTLELDGHTVATAADGARGIELARGTSPDVVLIDIGLPTLDGYAVAERIRAALGPKVVLVALTGYGAADDRRRAGAAGFDAHLVKPIAYDSLIHLLATHST